MACKYLTQKIDATLPETGGSLTPSNFPISLCQLGRTPNTMGWITKCEKTPENGPCWFRVSEYGAEAIDIEFNKRK